MHGYNIIYIYFIYYIYMYIYIGSIMQERAN